VRGSGCLLEVAQRVRQLGWGGRGGHARRLDHLTTYRKIVRTILRWIVKWSGERGKALPPVAYPAPAPAGGYLRVARGALAATRKNRRSPEPTAAPRRARGDRRLRRAAAGA